MIGKKINQLATELAPVSTDLTIIGDPISGVSKKITLAQLGAIFSGAVSFYTNLAGFPATGDINVIYCAKDTQKLYLWSGSAYVEVFPSQALLDTYQLRSEKGVSNGYASLDSSGKVPISQLPSSIMEYKGTWNAATNTPTLANGTGDTGDVYICNVAGTVNFGAGPITFAVGDYVIYSGSIWQRSSGAVGTVTSVAVSRSGDALAITGSPITTSGTINIGFAGTGTQYIKGDGTLATFPSIISQAQNLITEVYNNTGATLTKGTIVYINGGQGNLPTVAKALATGDSTSAQTFGVVQADITNMNNGYVVVAGRISDLDTQAYSNGTQLYLSPTTAGTWTSTKPYAPQHLVYVGIVVRAHPTQGVVEVKIQNGYEMDELHNVSAQSPDNNDILQYKTSTSLWTKVAGTTSNIAEGSNLYYTDARSRAALSFTAGSGAYNSTTGVITIPTNTNQLTNGANYITLASLSAGAGISYNNTTGVIASTITQYTDAMARASISLTTTGTSGAATYNSTTGVLNVPQYAPDLSGYVPTSRTLTINGTAFDLSANRSWSVGTVTSVGLSSATSGVTIGSTPITTSGTITLAIATASGSQQGLLSSTDWTTFNNKQNALTNPVTGTGTTNYLPKFTGTSTIGNSIVYDNGNGVAFNGTNISYAATNRGNITINGTSGIIGFNNSGNAMGYFFHDGTNMQMWNELSGSLIFGNAATTRMTIDASGNLGLGVTPSAWSTSFYNAIEGGDTNSQGAIAFNLNGTSSGVDLWANGFFDGTNSVYKYNGTAGLYQVAGNVHRWYNAPSGTAGNAISFTQAMTLNASGNLSIGNTNDTYKLDVSGTGMFRTTSTNPAIRVLLPGNANATILEANSGNSGFGWKIQQEEVSTGDFRIFRRESSVDYQVLNLARSTGAATFSSSVTATQGIFRNSGVPAIQVIRDLNVVSVGTAGQGIEFGALNGSTPTAGAAIYGTLDNPATTGALVFQTLNAGSLGTRMYINNSGNVGIGTTSPVTKLDVAGNQRLFPSSGDVNLTLRGFASQYINFTEASVADRGVIGFAVGSGDLVYRSGGYDMVTGTEKLRIASTGAATFSVNTNASLLITNTGQTPIISFRANGVTAAGKIRVDEAFGGGEMVFSTKTTGGVDTDRIIINSSGNVGIGTTSPAPFLNSNARTLDISNTSNPAELALTGQNCNLYLGNGGLASYIYSTGAYPLILGTNGSERMRITSGGAVSINTTQSLAQLNVKSSSSGSTARALALYNNIGDSVNTGVSIEFYPNGGDNDRCARISSVQATSGNYADLRFFTSNNVAPAEAMRITSGGNVEIATGSIKTGEPDTGWGRAAIKIGASVSGAAFNVTRYLPVSVDGTVYYINLNSSTP